MHTGYAKPSVSQGLRALIDVEAYESAGTSMAANGLVVSVNNVFDRALPTFNGIYISPGSYLCSTKTFLWQLFVLKWVKLSFNSRVAIELSLFSVLAFVVI